MIVSPLEQGWGRGTEGKPTQRQSELLVPEGLILLLAKQ